MGNESRLGKETEVLDQDRGHGREGPEPRTPTGVTSTPGGQQAVALTEPRWGGHG